MEKSIKKLITGYKKFSQQYSLGEESIMQSLADQGQKPEVMVISCCDSRVDPAIIFQCNPGDLFVVRNIASIVPPYENDERHHGTSAALEFAVRFLQVKHIILLGHSQCAGIAALISKRDKELKTDFIENWVSVVKAKIHDQDTNEIIDNDHYTKIALNQSFNNCLTFPWIEAKHKSGSLMIHRWFFTIKTAKISYFSSKDEKYHNLDD